MRVIKRSELEAMSDDRYRARLINCLSGVKTAILVGTVDKEQQTNLAVFSSIVHLGANPALMGLIVRPNVSSRHTLENILETGHFSLNIMPSSTCRQVHHTSARFAKEQSEFVSCGFSEEWHQGVPVPTVKESPVKWHLSLVRVIDIPENGTHMIMGAIEDIFLPEDIIKQDGFLDLEAIDPCLVTGLDCYHQVKGKQRFSYAKPDHEPMPIDL